LYPPATIDESMFSCEVGFYQMFYMVLW
jgi:hypothetical protein